MPRTIRDPSKKIEEGNCWYTDDQFAVQLGTPSSKFVVENRWRIFSEAMNRWIQRNETDRDKHTFHILDAGCGDGINLFGLLKFVKEHNLGVRIFGVDYNPLRLNRAQKIEGVTGLLQGSLTRLPFPDETFDIVLCNHVLEHITNDERALLELNRILRSKGLMILGVPNEGCVLARLRNRVVQPSIARTTDHVQLYTSSILEARATAAGFRIVHMFREGFFMPYLRINNLLQARAPGRALLSACRNLLPSQAADLIGIFSKC